MGTESNAFKFESVTVTVCSPSTCQLEMSNYSGHEDKFSPLGLLLAM